MRTATIIHYTSRKYTDGSSPLYIRVYVPGEQRRYIATELNVKPEHWNDTEKRLTDAYPSKGKVTRSSFEKTLISVKGRIDKILDNELAGTEWHVDDFIKAYNKKKILPKKLLEYFDEVVKRLKDSNDVGNAYCYANTKRVLSLYLGNKKTDKNKKDISFTGIDSGFINKFIEYCRQKGNKEGTISIYVRTFRSLYNKAIVDSYASEERYPFKGVDVPSGDAFKRALTPKEWDAFRNVELTEANLKQAREYFLFSVYMRGMNFWDMAELKLSNINDEGILSYVRKKTRKTRKKGKKVFKIKIPPQIKSIVNKYTFGKVSEDYIFPILNENHKSEMSKFNRIRKIRTIVNHDLKLIAIEAGINPKNFSFYSGRHSFATLAIKNGASIQEISESMGHSDLGITQTYLESFEDSELDKAMNKTLSKF